MKYHLLLFDQTVTEGNTGFLNEKSFSELVLLIKSGAHECRSAEELAFYIQNYQAELQHYRGYEICAEWADKLLHVLENSFWKYLDLSLPMSHLGREKQIGQYRDQLEGLREQAPKVLDPILATAIKPLLEICADCITHHEVGYVKALATEWNSGKGYSLADEESIVALLKAVNYNSGMFFNYLVNKMADKYIQEDCPRNQSQILLGLRMEYQRKEQNPGFAPATLGLAKQMDDWIRSELEVCYRRMELHKLEPPLESNPKTKMELSWSVDEVSCFFKQMRDSGFLINRSEKDIHQAISETFTTPRTGNISPVSVRTKYYQNDVTIRDSLRSKLLVIAKNLR